MLGMANSLVPLGFHFQPSDQELLRFFLHKMVVEREPLMPPHDNFVHKCNLFGNKLEPSEIWECYGGDQICGQELFFFCELNRRNPSRIDRKIGPAGGTWSEIGSSKLVYDKEENGNLNPIGRRRKFRYENPKSEDHARWYLDEYSLVARADGDDQKASKNHTFSSTGYDFDLVICGLRRKEMPPFENKRECSSSQGQSMGDHQAHKQKDGKRSIGGIDEYESMIYDEEQPLDDSSNLSKLFLDELVEEIMAHKIHRMFL